MPSSGRLQRYGLCTLLLGVLLALYRTSRTHSHKALNLLAISFMGHIDLKNNENRIKRFQRGAECATEAFVLRCIRL